MILDELFDDQQISAVNLMYKVLRVKRSDVRSLALVQLQQTTQQILALQALDARQTVHRYCTYKTLLLSVS